VSKSGAVSGYLLYEFAKFKRVYIRVYVILIVVLMVRALASMYTDICKYLIYKYIYKINSMKQSA
jgi:hypothetical protein